jgi:Trypsin-co-occurring domain 1
MVEKAISLDANEPPVLVDFQLGPGVYDVSLSPADIAQKSVEALNQAMHVIQHMAYRVVTTVRTMPERPSEIEVTFGIVLNMEAGALISKAGAEATINVKLTFGAGSKEEK